jgi:hypothetical protein
LLLVQAVNTGQRTPFGRCATTASKSIVVILMPSFHSYSFYLNVSTELLSGLSRTLDRNQTGGLAFERRPHRG